MTVFGINVVEPSDSTTIVSLVLYGCETWSFTLSMKGRTQKGCLKTKS
jgi:hypothetical protein